VNESIFSPNNESIPLRESGETVIVRSKREGIINTGARLFIYFFNFTHIYYYNVLGRKNKELLLGKRTHTCMLAVLVL